MLHRLLMLLCLFVFSACTMTHAPGTGATSQSDTSKQVKGNHKAAKPAIVMAPEFDDIPVPTELSRDASRSFVYEAPGVTMGVLTYSGYVKGASLAKFYRNEMPKYEWQFLNAFSEGERYLISFIKSDKSCMISVEEGTLSTRLTIKVGPTEGR